MLMDAQDCIIAGSIDSLITIMCFLVCICLPSYFLSFWVKDVYFSSSYFCMSLLGMSS
uniref:Uncharacterized protein n=1 Tax=Rhizophora mucronata TaxID=61149 RepID=A0A2P2P1Y1_RHIMU